MRRLLFTVLVLISFSATTTHAQDCSFRTIAGRAENTDIIGVTNAQDHKFLALWYHRVQDSGTDSRIQGRHISQFGTLDKTKTYSFSPPAGSEVATEFGVAYNSRRNEYLIAWNHIQGTSPNKSGLYFRRIDSTGKSISSPTLISEVIPFQNSYKPYVAYNSVQDEYLVGAGFNELFFFRISSDGKLLGNSPSLKDSTASFQSIDSILTDPEQPDYFVFWTSTKYTSNGSRISNHLFQRLDSKGSPVGSFKKLATRGFSSSFFPTAVFHPVRKEFLFLYGGGKIKPGIVQLRRIRVDLFGRRRSPSSVVAIKSYVWDARAVYSPDTNGYLLLYEREVNSDSQLYLQRLNEKGLKAGTEVRLTCDQHQHSQPVLLFDETSGTYSALWTTGLLIGAKLFQIQ
jgi:hypothetical protein